MGASEPKRFYRTAGVTAEGRGYAVVLDGRPVRTPLGRPLVLPAEGLARLVAHEWDAQVDHIRPHTMPVMRLVATALDRVAEAREGVIDGLLSYAGSDALCYRAEAPAELAARQAAGWGPILDWLADSFGARLAVTSGIVAVSQPDQAVAALRSPIAALDDLRLSALASAVSIVGSLALGLALLRGRVGADEAFELSRIEEIHQNERWGEDAEARARNDRLRAELVAAQAVLRGADQP